MIETVRCFVALDLPAEVAERLCEAQRNLAEVAGSTTIRWVSPTTMHLTLKFLGGDVDKGILTPIGDALVDVCRDLPPFSLSAAGMGTFGVGDGGLVVWSGLEDPTGDLAVCRSRVEAAMVELGFDADARFHPHVTLARVSAGSEPIASTIEEYREMNWGQWTCRDVVLYRSRLGPRGPRYEPIVRASLQGHSAGAEEAAS